MLMVALNSHILLHCNNTCPLPRAVSIHPIHNNPRSRVPRNLCWDCHTPDLQKRRRPKTSAGREGTKLDAPRVVAHRNREEGD